MEALLQKIQTLTTEIQNTVATTSAEVEAFRIKYLGTKGLVKNMMSEMKSVPNENKKEFGQILNAFKIAAEEKLEQLLAALGDTTTIDTSIDISLPRDEFTVGTRHPLNLVRNQIVSIFKRLGFAVAEGPEIEDDWHNFGAMNLPADHPARDPVSHYRPRPPDPARDCPGVDAHQRLPAHQRSVQGVLLR